MKERVLNRTGKNPELSTTRIAIVEDLDHTTVVKITSQSQQLKSYYPQRVRALEDGDYE